MRKVFLYLLYEFSLELLLLTFNFFLKAFERSDILDFYEFAQLGFGISLMFITKSYQKKGTDCLVELPSLKLIGFKVLPTTSLIL